MNEWNNTTAAGTGWSFLRGYAGVTSTDTSNGGGTKEVDLNGQGIFVTEAGLTTAGLGNPIILGITSQRSETGADTNLLTVTPASVVGNYHVCVTMSVSAASSAVLGWTMTWKDSNGNAQTPTNEPLTQSGTAAPALTFTTSAAGNYSGCMNVDTDNSGTNIVVKTTFSGSSVAYKASATVERLF
jgi:hypothetical protein